ncbi:stage III sporulation protein AF [Thermoflavimicrobium daqui]|jgi:stage III sporulation protein AF|uniref:Stage III sporulation protein AF n=1 Tax=Thermoflavimicrobium daqui TaxID=2137476 RepID=A0A364K8E6_9BACL|nr:stage III sporulation protein AF [Thermoflavimicrobium daqui]RAL26569.1 stage III sporulation protein AF [Thermoflavimicrobium daqui]
MVEWLTDWIKQIILLVLIATFLDLLLPNHSMERYVKLVMGLIIIMAILSPIFKLIKNDLNLANLATTIQHKWNMKEMSPIRDIKENADKLQKNQDQLIQKQTEKSMEKIIKQNIQTKFGVEVVQAKVKTELNRNHVLEIKQIEVVTRTKSINQKSPTKTKSMEPVAPVHVEITPTIIKPSNQVDKSLAKEITEYLKQSWQVTTEQIHILIEAPR